MEVNSETAKEEWSGRDRLSSPIGHSATWTLSPNSQMRDGMADCAVEGEIRVGDADCSLSLENESSVAEKLWDLLEEGITIIVNLFEHPGEGNCAKSLSQLDRSGKVLIFTADQVLPAFA